MDTVEDIALDFKSAFSQGKWVVGVGRDAFADGLAITTMPDLKAFLDAVHIRECLLRPYFETEDYPLVDPRSLLPSFEPDAYEYRNLPGFSLLAIDRPLNSLNEIFQYDMLYPVTDLVDSVQGNCCPLEHHILNANTQTMLSRLPRNMHDGYRKEFQRNDATILEAYPQLLPYILIMDRAHVMAKNNSGQFKLAGVFASLPSDINGELKRFGMRIGKFHIGDNELYERNRSFVAQFLMELYGFSISSERRTSAALFSRRLHKIGEHFIIRVLGQSDRTITTIWNDGNRNSRYPQVEKLALISLEKEQTDLIAQLQKEKAFVDEKKLVVIIKILYTQHAYDQDNVRQGRALSVASQQIIHPLTGETISGLNIIRDSSNLNLRLNDIVRGEYSGRIVYKRTEVIENTDTEEKRLKFLYSWLTKHQRRFIGYSDEFFTNSSRVIDAYLEHLNKLEVNDELGDFILEVKARYAYIQQARIIRILEDIKNRHFRGEHLSYARMLSEAIALLQDFKFELSFYIDDIVDTSIHLIEAMLNDRYLCKNYIEKSENKLTKAGLQIRQKYRKLVVLRDEFQSIQRTHKPVSLISL